MKIRPCWWCRLQMWLYVHEWIEDYNLHPRCYFAKRLERPPADERRKTWATDRRGNVPA